ncbi:hydrogenase 4 subunit F [Candidatus Peregrinibacteria bacterium]|nr:hydrogenase 4 subunit F [Candidatus Peregrinibacteria bacterium]
MELLLIFGSFFIAAFLCVVLTSRRVIECISIVATVIALVESIIISLKVGSVKTYVPFYFFSIESFEAIVMLIIAFVGLATTIYSVQYLRQETLKNIIGFTRVKQYFILLNLFLLAMFLAISANSPILAWIAIEATTLSTAFLISFYNKPSVTEAAWKYLIINSVGLLLGFFGTLLYFTSVNELSGNSFYALRDAALHLDPLIAKIAFIFILIGYGTKVGLAPMHTWLPDAHSKAPAPVSALLSGVLLNVAFVIVMKFKIITDFALRDASFSNNLLIIFGLLSIFVAALIILTQKNYKRLLAYSSIENMGIISLGFGFGPLGIYPAVLHMIYHSLIKSALFLSAGTIFLKYSSTKIAKVKGMLSSLPITSILFLVGIFAITGAPPFGIFLTKISILSVGIKIHAIVSIVAMFLMAILFIGFLKHASSMAFGEKPSEVTTGSSEFKTGKENIWLILPPLALLALALFLSFYFPRFLLDLLNAVTISYKMRGTI